MADFWVWRPLPSLQNSWPAVFGANRIVITVTGWTGCLEAEVIGARRGRVATLYFAGRCCSDSSRDASCFSLSFIVPSKTNEQSLNIYFATTTTIVTHYPQFNNTQIYSFRWKWWFPICALHLFTAFVCRNFRITFVFVWSIECGRQAKPRSLRDPQTPWP